MDLAMPGIDGWETLQRLRVAGLTATACAIVSANAFDKGLDNTAGIGPDDFFVKPVRHRELLDWLGRRLDLVWTAEVAPLPGAGADPLPDAPTPPAAAAPAGPWPEAASLAALEQAVTLGYYRGILNALDQIGREQPACAAFVDPMREHALAFRFEAMHQILSTARHAQPAA
jgi:CheY-like chemotaxis protein